MRVSMIAASGAVVGLRSARVAPARLASLTSPRPGARPRVAMCDASSGPAISAAPARASTVLSVAVAIQMIGSAPAATILVGMRCSRQSVPAAVTVTNAAMATTTRRDQVPGAWRTMSAAAARSPPAMSRGVGHSQLGRIPAINDVTGSMSVVGAGRVMVIVPARRIGFAGGREPDAFVERDDTGCVFVDVEGHGTVDRREELVEDDVGDATPPLFGDDVLETEMVRRDGDGCECAFDEHDDRVRCGGDGDDGEPERKHAHDADGGDCECGGEREDADTAERGAGRYEEFAGNARCRVGDEWRPDERDDEASDAWATVVEAGDGPQPRQVPPWGTFENDLGLGDIDVGVRVFAVVVRSPWASQLSFRGQARWL